MLHPRWMNATLLAMALCAACVTTRPSPPVESAPPTPAPATEAAPVPEPAPAPEPTPAPVAEPAPAQPAACSAEAAVLVEQGQAAQRERGEDGAGDALALYRRALELDPSCGQARWEMGWSHQSRGDHEAAVAAWDELRKTHPSYPGLEEHYPSAVRRRDQAAGLRALPDPGKIPPPEVVPAEGAPLRIAAVGDVQLGRAWPQERATLPPDDAAHLFDGVRDSLKDADVTFGNLETVLADVGDSQKCGKKSTRCYSFRVPTAFAKALREAGFTVMSIANNHAGDFGPQGRLDTMAALDAAGIQHSGPVGDIAYFEAQGRRIAMVAFSFGQDVYRIQELEIARRLVASLSRGNDLVVVSFHNGAEGKGADRVPRGKERFLGEDRGDPRAFAHTVVDAGADLVLGHGPHVLRALEVYKGRLIAYSMGNFSSWDTFSLAYPNGITGVFHFTLAPNGVALELRVDPVVMTDPGPGTPMPDPEKRAVEILRRLSKLDFGDPVLDEQGRWQLQQKRAAAAPQ